MSSKAEQKQAITALEEVENRIHVIREQRVMLDSDLAAVYQVETRVLNEAVNRNLKRFPKDFVFQLTKDEFDSLMSTVTSNTGRGGRRKLP